ncbi:dihydrolipoamide acetyltransferase family protein [Catelliglobosispora koreensis]|uniref:dihydrolipoamide acetyltransferase family protein n=1 Tax=Catelliglobosispora koreensis TaxID=129052 RepID=UPI0003722FDA|nr:dihydrolipoamide acetyltransferase family protein [Catelliglobosispora koreensis]
MNTEFRMPSLGADMESGVLLEWLVHPGDTVHKGDIVAVVDTAKAAVEVECFTSGVVTELLVEPGTRVPVGGPLAVISTTTGEQPHAAPTVAAPGVVTSPLVRHLADQLHVDTGTTPGTGVGGRITRADVIRQAEPVRISPRARRLAAERGVDLRTIGSTTPGRVITGDEVLAAADALGRPEHDAKGIDPQAMRNAIAQLMAKSKKEIPHYYLTEQIDMSTALAWLHEQNRALPVAQRILPAALLLRAVASACAEVPQLNGFWIDGSFVPAGGVHLGVAISLRGGGLVAPAIRDAGTLSAPELMAALRDLVSRTRAGRLRASEMSDPTITVSNLGDQGADSLLGVIYPPQVALVGFGRIAERPWASGGMLGVRPVVTASLAADHRATDGVTGALFLQAIARQLQLPEEK